MTGLVAFIGARLDEDEAAAKAAPGERWSAFTESDIAGASVYDEQWVLLYPQHYDHDNKLSAKPGATGPQYIERARDQLAAHIALHDPARVLREVEAKRAIVAAHTHYDIGFFGDPDVPRCEVCITERVGYEEQWVADLWPCLTLRALAAAWSDHPGYQQEWAPG